MMKKLFGSKKEQVPPPQPKFDAGNKEQLREMEREYKKQLQREMRELDRGVLKNDLTMKKAEAELKKALKESRDRSVHAIYAKQIAQCRKQKTRLLNNKAKVQGLVFAIESMFANIRMTKILGDTTGVIKQINGLMNVKEMTQTMKDIQKSMMQFGLMNEMVDDVMENMDEDAVDMDEEDLDKIIDSVQNPEKQKQLERGQAGAQIQHDFGDLEAKLKELS